MGITKDSHHKDVVHKEGNAALSMALGNEPRPFDQDCGAGAEWRQRLLRLRD